MLPRWSPKQQWGCETTWPSVQMPWEGEKCYVCRCSYLWWHEALMSVLESWHFPQEGIQFRFHPAQLGWKSLGLLSSEGLDLTTLSCPISGIFPRRVLTLCLALCCPLPLLRRRWLNNLVNCSLREEVHGERQSLAPAWKGRKHWREFAVFCFKPSASVIRQTQLYSPVAFEEGRIPWSLASCSSPRPGEVTPQSLQL